ncbi:MAG: M23 family metallopeptidase [Anaerolineae bacterium]|nr:M23 family metallopeptidase [Anaerolineae bacterium]
MRRIIFTLSIVSIVAGAALFSDGWGGHRALGAQEPPLPFRLPLDTPSGPSTWYIIQFYGNTQNAYYFRSAWYGQGQGLHFGVDFSTPCGMEIVAMADGVVAKVDALSHGSGPHNLMIDHPDGYASFYGHLLERSSLEPGRQVKQGQVIGLTGDPDLTCTSRPHLHIEIRDSSYYHTYNPIPLIDADWDSLALLGPGNPFQRDLDNPRRWVTLEDQPEVLFGGPMLNEYVHPWPPDWY